jgi:hypothetical protein
MTETKKNNMRSSDYLTESLRSHSEAEKQEVFQRKLKAQRAVLDLVHRPLVLTQEMVDVFMVGEPSEEQIKQWAEAAKEVKLSEQPKPTSQKISLPVPQFPTRPKSGPNARYSAEKYEE